MKANIRDIQIKTNNINLQVKEYKHDGEAIIFLHFGSGNLMMWEKIIPYFQAMYHLILVDMRGHGKSDKPPCGNHIDEMAKDIIGVMEHLNIEKTHVIGSSMGAEVGLSMAANFPEKVITLSCEGALHSEYGPYGVWEGTEEEFKKSVVGHIEQTRNTPDPVFASIDELVADTRQALEKYGWWNEYFEGVKIYDAYQIDEEKYTYSWQKASIENYMKHYFGYRFEDYYSRTACPVLILPGQREIDTKVINKAMKKLCELTPNGKIVAVPGWIHPYGWLLEPAEDMCRVVLDFLKEGRK